MILQKKTEGTESLNMEKRHRLRPVQNVKRRGCTPTNLHEIITFPATGWTPNLAKKRFGRGLITV
jgi:hypothetical protein